MFNLFKKKSPTQKLQSQYEKLLEEAMSLQRKGDIKGYAAKTAEAEAIAEKIQSMS